MPIFTPEVQGMNRPEEVTQLLVEAGNGSRQAMDQLLPLVYDELHALAGGLMRRERQDHTLQATALVHEAYLKLVDQTRVQWQDRTHFFAVAAQAIRRILVDHARSHRRIKRGGGGVKITLVDELAVVNTPVVDVIALDEALVKLADAHPEEARIVEIRFFAGLTTEETARLLKTTTRTVERKWRFARAWLFQALGTPGPRPPEQGRDV